MTTSRERALTLALDIVKKQAGPPLSASEFIILMQRRNAKTTHVSNHASVDGASALRRFGNLDGKPRVMLSEAAKLSSQDENQALPAPTAATLF
jgi:hypothetical protein